jgi:hypothetical protein
MPKEPILPWHADPHGNLMQLSECLTLTRIAPSDAEAVAARRNRDVQAAYQAGRVAMAEELSKKFVEKAGGGA